MLALLFLLQSPVSPAPARDPRPVLRAHLPRLDVRDGALLYVREWEPDPTLPTDVYSVRRTAETKRITLVSDRGELELELAPGTTQEFWLELDERRMPLSVSARPRPARRDGPAQGPRRIPLRIANRKLHLTGRINGSDELDLIFDTGASVCCLYPSGAAKGARFQADLEVMNNGESRRGLELGGEVEVADLRWSDEPVLFIEKQADHADGILGYTVFEDKVLEFDFTRMELIVHDSLPELPAGFTRAPMPYSGTLTAVEVELVATDWRAQGEFWFDTGSDATLIVSSSTFAEELAAHFPKIGVGTSEGVGPRITQHALLNVEELVLAGTPLSHVPILAKVAADGAEAEDAKGLAVGVVGMPVLERFDLVLDYPRGQAYLRPNARVGEPFERPRPPRNGLARVAALVLALSVLALGLRALRSRRRAARSAL